MTLPPGTRLGPYEILSALGAGGMGEVYRARDAKLNRDVAIKVLLPSVANDPDRLARFSREAQVLASLNHPNIAHIHGLEEANGITALVLELVEGEDLAQRIARGPIPLDEALPIARQIAEALEAAHHHGIIHRDLKPANIKVRADGTVKVLDFGLAKAVDPTAGSSATAMNSPTLSIHATQAGIILGTAAYMSPEQARGKAVDKRTDIWALGCVLFEMLTGTRAFPGDAATDTIIAVCTKEPKWSALPASVPSGVRTLLRRSLEKDPKRRLDSAAAVRIEIDDALNPSNLTNLTNQPNPNSWSRFLPWGVAAVALAVAIGVSLAFVTRPPSSTAAAQPVHMLLSERQSVSGSGGERSFAISPDGSRMVFRTDNAGASQLHVRDMTSTAASPIPGTEGATGPFFSPDGQRIGFFAASKLQVVNLTGGRPETVADVIIPRGGTWAPDNSLIYSPATDAGLWTVPAAGGTPRLLAQPDPAKGERGYRWPQILPGGDAVLFTVATSDILSFDDAPLVVRSLRTGEQHEVGRGSPGTYVASGEMVYARAGSLLAVPFDLVQLKATGTPRPVLNGVVTSLSGGAQFAVSSNGTLMYVQGKLESVERTLAWVSRTGEISPIALPPAPYQQVSMSPDARQVAIDIDGANASIWVLDLERTALTRLTLQWSNNSPSWTSDPNRVAFTSARAGSRGLFWQRVDNQGGQEPVFPRKDFEGQVGTSTWLPDGRSVIFAAASPRTSWDLWVVQLDSDRTPKPLLQTAFTEVDPSVSPDGRWLSYVSEESGRLEVYLQPYPGPGRKTRISVDGGNVPKWARDGRELFYWGRDGLMSVPINPASGLPAGQQRLLFGFEPKSPNGPIYAPFSSYGVGLDGRFLVIQPPKSAPPVRLITVVLNWFEEMKAGSLIIPAETLRRE